MQAVGLLDVLQLLAHQFKNSIVWIYRVKNVSQLLND